MTIKEPFGPWKHGVGPDVIRRDSGTYAFWISLRDNCVIYRCVADIAGGTVIKQPGPSLAEAVAYVDEYIANNFTVEKTTELKLQNALAEIDLLKQELRVALRKDSHESVRVQEPVW